METNKTLSDLYYDFEKKYVLGQTFEDKALVDIQSEIDKEILDVMSNDALIKGFLDQGKEKTAATTYASGASWPTEISYVPSTTYIPIGTSTTYNTVTYNGTSTANTATGTSTTAYTLTFNGGPMINTWKNSWTEEIAATPIPIYELSKPMEKIREIQEYKGKEK